MTLEIIKTVRDGLERGEPLRHSDITALVATCEMIWNQVVTAQAARAVGQHRREYMRHYMRRYRAQKREALATTAIASESGPH